uniref:Uncharacterized protein n=1 Tax=Lutzomyia longipalpis TaxID=7200 RepID=A0A7G3B9X5_LUTLO
MESLSANCLFFLISWQNTFFLIFFLLFLLCELAELHFGGTFFLLYILNILILLSFFCIKLGKNSRNVQAFADFSSWLNLNIFINFFFTFNISGLR